MVELRVRGYEDEILNFKFWIAESIARCWGGRLGLSFKIQNSKFKIARRASLCGFAVNLHFSYQHFSVSAFASSFQLFSFSAFQFLL